MCSTTFLASNKSTSGGDLLRAKHISANCTLGIWAVLTNAQQDVFLKTELIVQIKRVIHTYPSLRCQTACTNLNTSTEWHFYYILRYFLLHALVISNKFFLQSRSHHNALDKKHLSSVSYILFRQNAILLSLFRWGDRINCMLEAFKA